MIELHVQELHALKKQYAEVESKCTLYQNQYEGMKSHANQLQLLVKEHVSNIEALKIEKNLEENNSDDYNKDLSSKQKEIEVLLKHLKSLGKDNAFKMVEKKLRKRHKVLLQQYEKLSSICSEDDSSSDSGNDQPDFYDDSPCSPLLTPSEDSAMEKTEQNVCNTNKMQICIKKDSIKLNEDNDCDFSNEVVSVDTGRGSSLAFSDGEKCFNSPDYFSNDSPIAKEINQENEQTTLVDTGTSPIRCQEEVHIARSPRIFDDDEYFITDIPLNDEIVTIKEKRKVIDIGTSPIKDMEKVNIATSPLLFDECVERNIVEVLPKLVATDRQTNDHVNSECQPYIINRKSSCTLIDDTVPIVKGTHTKIDNLISHCELDITGKSNEERKCLEINNSINFCDESSNDGEIEMILNTMRLTQRLITPIPETPVNKREIRRKEDREHEYLKLREENKIILSSVNEVKKAMIDLQCLFLNQLNDDKSKVDISNVSNKIVNTKIFDDTSQETILINSNNDNCDNGNEESEVNNIDFSNTLRNYVPQESQQDILKQATPSSTSKLRDILPLEESTSIDNSIEKGSSTVNVNDVAHVTKNKSHEAITFEEDLISEDESDIIINDNVNNNAQGLSIRCSNTKKIKNKKLSKLDKFKQKMLPKSRISNSASNRKLRSKPKLTPATKKISQLDATAILNNKSAYEHAAKVLAEIKSKDKNSAIKKRIARTAKKPVDDQSNYHVGNIEYLEQQEHTSEKEGNKSEKHIRRKSNDQHIDTHLESMEDECSLESTRSRIRKLSSNYCVSPTTTSHNEGNDPEKHIRRKSNDQHNDKHLESMEDEECLPVSTRSRSRKLSSNYCVSPTTISHNEGNNSEKHIRQKSNGQHNDKHLESMEDDECLLVSTRSRSRKLSSNYCVSPTTMSHNEGNNLEKYIRRKLSDQHNDENLESMEDDECSSVTTRSRSRKISSNYCVSPTSIDTRETSKLEEKRKRLKRGATDSPIFHFKRVLRSSNNRKTLVDLDTVRQLVSYNDIDETFSDSPKSRNHNSLSNSTNEKLCIGNDDINNSHVKTQDGNLLESKNEEQNSKAKNVTNSPNNNQNRKLCQDENDEQTVNHNIKNISNAPYRIQDHKSSDLDNAIENRSTEVTDVNPVANQFSHPKQSILCRMLEKHGRGDSKSSNKKVSDNITDSICKKLEESIAFIRELPAGKVKPAMNKLVDEVQSWDVKHFMLGFMKYLKDPDRKRELFNKVNSPSAPPMTKSEQVLLYVVRQMEMQTPNTVNVILTHIEFSLFQLNRTPEFDIIESLSHFYALLCRYFGLRSRLRLFLLDAMYCIKFKVIPLIKQCLDVWMHILPLAHMGIAKSPLVTCLVYLLHFYKCEDRFNRVQEIRTILSRKYFYQTTDWSEKKILEMFKNAIKDVRDIPIEKKMLRTALIILGKRHGAKWCLNNIIKNMLMPMIEKEDISMKIKLFCVQLLGALIKPFPADMKVHFEIVINHLHDMLQQDPPDAMKEAIFTSLIYINHHNPNGVIRSLLSWTPKQVSPEFEQLMRDYVRGKPLHLWKKILSKIPM